MNLKAAKALGLTLPESFLLRRRPGDRIKQVIAAVHESVHGRHKTDVTRHSGVAKELFDHLTGDCEQFEW
jgi:hypothetical protein